MKTQQKIMHLINSMQTYYNNQSNALITDTHAHSILT